MFPADTLPLPRSSGARHGLTLGAEGNFTCRRASKIELCMSPAGGGVD